MQFTIFKALLVSVIKKAVMLSVVEACGQALRSCFDYAQHDTLVFLEIFNSKIPSTTPNYTP